MSDSATVRLSPNWPANQAGNVVLFIQATAAAAYLQKVTITGSNLSQPVMATSNPNSPFGTQFLNKVYTLPYQQYQNYVFDVTIQYQKTGVWQPSNIVAVNSIPIGTKNKGQEIAEMAFVLSNDAGQDNDYNDTVVLFSMYDQSND